MEYGAGGQLRLSVIVFLTLQHRVVVGGKLGPMHSHSCSVEVELSPPRGDTIPFAEIEAEIKAQITPLDGKPLNDLANFQGINPSIENFAAHLFNRLSLISAEYGAALHSVIVRESPTRAVKYVREQPVTVATGGDEIEERRVAPVIRLPVGPRQDSGIDNIRRLRSPVEELPLSPNQRASEDFLPADSIEQSQSQAGAYEARRVGFAKPPATKVAGALSAADAAMWAAAEATETAVSTSAAEPEDTHDGPATPPPPPPTPASTGFSSTDVAGQGSKVVDVAPRVPAPQVPSAQANPHEAQPDSWSGALPSRRDRKHKGGKGKGPSPAYPADRDSRPKASGMLAVSEPQTLHAMKASEPARSTAPAKSKNDEADDSEEPAGSFFKRPFVVTSLILLFFVCAIAFLYRRVLWPAPGQGYPWGSDTWGHVKKAQFLLQEMMSGNFFPSFSPMWYNGVEPFRYWAPMPYYLLAGLMRALSDPFLAAGWYVALCAFIGGAGWLLMRKRLGVVESALAGFVWMFWQDNVRVAMSEGNLPRTLVTALFPYLLHCFLLVLEKPEHKHFGRFVALAAVSSVAILSHAMIAATFFIGLTIMGTFWALWMGIKARALLRGVLGIFSGIGLSAWWLVPSLQNGLMAVNKEAVSEAMQYFPITVSMNPYLRLTQPEIFYWGISMIAVIGVVLATWKKRNRLAQSAVFVGLAFIALTIPQMKSFYSSIPMHHLIFPLYMVTVASGILILAAFSWRKSEGETRKDVMVRLGVSALVALMLAVDAYPSTAMVNTRTEPAYLRDLSRHMPEGGWREATLDLSRFGSAATYILGNESNREQVYGWAWQGATTSTNIVAMNTSLEIGFYPYLADRLVEMGATHLVLRRGVADEEELLAEMSKIGYEENWRSSEAIVLSMPGGPYALRTEYEGIVIGKFAPNWTKLYPALATGPHTLIDEYTFADLEQYNSIIISGAAWEDRTAAEELIAKLASVGKTILVDLEGLPEDVLSKRPIFMGVSGEPVLIYRGPQIFEPESDTPVGTVQAFAETHYPWKALAPQGMDKIVYQFPHLGEYVSVLGTRSISAGTVWFIGANLPYHAYLTEDPFTLKLISDVIGVAPGQTPVRTKVDLYDYRASANGYTFSLQVPEAMGQRSLAIPIASRENMTVEVDGVQVKYDSLHSLLQVNLDPGYHRIDITPSFPASMRSGAGVALGTLAFLALTLVGQAVSRSSVLHRKPVIAE